MQFSQIRRSAQNLIEGRANLETVRAEFIEAANLFKFGYLLDVLEADQKPEADSVLFKTANYILKSYNDHFYYVLSSLIDTAKEYLHEQENTINYVDAIYDLAHNLDITSICDDLSYAYDESSEINKPENTRHLYSDQLLEEFDRQIQKLEDYIKPKLIAICEDILTRYDKEYMEDLEPELQ